MFLAINPGGCPAPARHADHRPGLRPAGGVDRAGLRDQAHALGYTVVDASTVVATHLNHLILSHAAELLGRRKPRRCSTTSPRTRPRLVEDLVPKQLPLASVQRVLQNLLEEGVTLRDMRTIIETSPSTRRASRIRSSSPPRCGWRWAAPSSSSSIRATPNCR
jgi:flagellar biosynthesis protein FlhA